MTYVWQSGSITGPKAVKGFKLTAQVATNPSYQYPGYDKTTMDLELMVGLCESTVNDEELENLESHMEQLVYNIIENGENTDLQMDELGIMKTEGTPSRDGNVKFNYN